MDTVAGLARLVCATVDVHQAIVHALLRVADTRRQAHVTAVFVGRAAWADVLVWETRLERIIDIAAIDIVALLGSEHSAER